MNYSGRRPGNRVSPQLEAADVEVNRLRRLIAERDDALQHNLLLRDGLVAHGAADVVFGSTPPNSRQIPERETTVTKLSSNEGTDSVVHAVTSFSCSGGGSTAGMPSDCVEAKSVPNLVNCAITVESEEVQYSRGDATEACQYVRRGGGGPAQNRVRSARAFFSHPTPMDQYRRIYGHYPVSRAEHPLRDWLPSCPYLDLSGLNADVKTWLREGRWPLKDGAVVEGKS